MGHSEPEEREQPDFRELGLLNELQLQTRDRQILYQKRDPMDQISLLKHLKLLVPKLKLWVVDPKDRQ